MLARILLTTIIALALLLPALPADAARVNTKKLKKWPAEDAVWVKALDTWMSEDELKLILGMKETAERQKFLEDAGQWMRWEKMLDSHKKDTTIPDAIRKGELVEGMIQDEVYMSWDKPTKIRKDFRGDDYVNVLVYTFEIDRKGREFLSWDESPTAYNNETLEKYVYMFDGKVFRIVNAGDEEDVMADLPGSSKEPEDVVEEESTEAKKAEDEADFDFSLDENDRKAAEKIKKQQEEDEEKPLEW
jgi:hypothetical protein